MLKQTSADFKEVDLERPTPEEPESDLGIFPGSTQDHSKSQQTNDIILRMECMSDRQMKAALGVSYCANVLAFVALFTEFSIKLTGRRDDWPDAARAAAKANVSIGCVCLVELVWIAALWARRLIASHRLGKIWKRRRRRISILVELELLVQIINLIALLIPNSFVLYTPCNHINQYAITVMVAVRWTCWNTLFQLICIHAHNVNPWRNKSGCVTRQGQPVSTSTEPLVMDGPWSTHWPKLIIWCVMVVITALGCWQWIKQSHAPMIISGYSYCDERSVWRCDASRLVQVLLGLIVGCAFAWFTLWLNLIYRAKHHLYGLPYTDYKVANLFLRLQERGRWVFIVFFCLQMSLQWYVNNSSCASIAFTWQGLLPMQILASLNIGAWSYMMMPLSPGQEEVPKLQVWLQEFVWTRQQHQSLQKQRKQSGQVDHASGHALPLFCMEQTFSALYWSGLVYDSHETEAMEAKMGWGYELLGLEEHELVWEHRLDTKVLIGSGPNGIAIAFRGTASLRNAISDIQAWRADHPPKRGSKWLNKRPVVHSGFLQCWLEDGLGARVTSRLLQLATAWSAAHQGQPVPILFTGHSLGGALCQLAAYDLVKAASEAQLPIKLACYTFGAPRVGNHAFAHDFAEQIPDTWNIINDQDVIARRGKLWFLYKRAGHRVIINARGDLIVRPSFAEANVQRVPGGGSINQHYLGSYQQAMLAVCLAQFSAKRYREGMEGVTALAHAARPLAALFQQELSMSADDMAELARSGAPEQWHVRRKQLRTGAPEQWRDSALHARSSLTTHDSSSTAAPSVQDSSRALLGAAASERCLLPHSRPGEPNGHANEPCAMNHIAINRDVSAGAAPFAQQQSAPLGDVPLGRPSGEGICSTQPHSMSEHHGPQDKAGVQPSATHLPDAAAADPRLLQPDKEHARDHSSSSPLEPSSAEAPAAGEAAARDQLHPLASELDQVSLGGLIMPGHGLNRHRQGTLEKHRHNSLDWHGSNRLERHKHSSSASAVITEAGRQTTMQTNKQAPCKTNEFRSLGMHHQRSCTETDTKALSMPILGLDGAVTSAQGMHVGEGQTQETARLSHHVPTAVAGHVRGWFSRMRSGRRDPPKPADASAV
ncbi:hypothetical protein WJX74_005593 [Apatococcus lobatus]|uniref:Fungal lipase-type domain-containing protein n=1 Tax=Apatococcus lobatus TaxID=904363 RepID=A0AAW1QTE5_9CHLO